MRTAIRGDDPAEFGTLSIRVMPSDATILIDQQAWDRPRGDERFSIELVKVRTTSRFAWPIHNVMRTIDVPRGQSVVVNVALTPGGAGTVPVPRTATLRR